MTLSGQSVVVVGGTSGMGLATVRAAAAEGAEVIAAGRRPVAEREPIDGVRQAQVDVTDEASVRALFDGVGALDHLFVSSSPGAPARFSNRTWRRRARSWTASCWAAGHARATPRRACGRRLDHVRDRLRRRPPAAPRRDGHGGVRRGRGALSRAGARARTAAREHDPPRLHRQRDVVRALRRPRATTCAGAWPMHCPRGAWARPTTSRTPPSS